MRHLFTHSLILFLLVISCKTFSQIAVTPTSGCMPTGLTNATYNYLGPTASSLTWNFGDGSPTSNLVSPQHSYLNPGSYTVQCTAIVGGSPQTFTFLVQVFPQPSGGMGAPVIASSGCAPRMATLSATSNNPNYTYNWAFGDNSGGTGTTVTHAYGTQGSWYPTLTILDNLTGCSRAYTGTTPIHVSNPPNVTFAFSSGNPCVAPMNAAFSASLCSPNSPLPGPLQSYFWNFGNSITSTNSNVPSVNFTSGIYIATLSVTDNNNCSNSVTQQISVTTPTLQVTVPPAVCVASQMPVGPAPNNPFGPLSPIFMVTISTSESSSYWNMGDGSPLLQFPSNNMPLTPNTPFGSTIHAYYIPGLKIGTVTVSNPQGCTASQTFAIFVEQIQPNFATAPHIFTCSPSIVVNYTNLTVSNYTAPLSYTWFAQAWNPLDTYSSTAVNPTFNFTQGSTSPYTIYDTYRPEMNLWVKSQVGCEAKTKQIYDSIRRPTAFFYTYKNEGCAPLSVTFLDSSFTNVNVFPITSYTWHSGAGSTQTVSGTLVPPATVPNYSFTYTSPGVYHPYLEIQTLGGCSSTSYQGTITVVNPPQIAMSLTPNLSVCAGQSLQVNLTTTTNPPPQHVHVESGANYFSGCVSDPSPIWAYHTPGVYGFTISAYLNSCSVTSIPVQTILVKGPAAALQYSTNCNDKLKVDFKYALRDVQSATLNFGAGTNPPLVIPGIAGNTVTGTSTFTYPSTGNFTASITGINAANGCGPYTQTALVTVRQASAAFSFSPIVCWGELTNFVAQSFTDNVVGCGVGYAWFFDNDPPQVFSTSTNATFFTSVGIHTVTLRVKDGNSCIDTARATFRVTKPVPTFTFNANPICYSNYPVQLFNFTPQTPDVVNSFTWMYGPPLNQASFPQTTQTVTGVGNQTFNFNIGASITQTFDVKLIAKDVNGCVDSIRHKVQVNNPDAYIYPTFNTCIPTGIHTFYFWAHPTYTNYFLNFGPNSYTSSSSNTLTTITFTQPGIFNPTLTITDNGGCTATDTLNFKFEVQTKPVADFSVQASNSSFCIPRRSSITLTLTSTSNTLYPVNFQWNNGVTPPTTGSSSLAIHSYTAGQTLTLGLTLQPFNVPASCWDTKTLVVNLYDIPAAQAVVNKTLFCKGDPLIFTLANDTAVHHWQWDFGDNQPTVPSYTPANKSTTYTYPPNFFPESTNGNIFIILTFSSPFDGCKNIDTLRVKMIRVLSDFKRNNELGISDYAHCLGVSDTFSNTTQSNGSFMTYTWSFGDGNGSTATHPTYTYPAAGNYTVNLIAKDFDVGCTNSTSKTMTVYPLPTASINVEDLACPDSVFVITGNGTPGLSGTVNGTVTGGGNTYGVSFDANNSFSIQASAAASTAFSLQVSDANNCKSSPVWDSIRIQLSPPSLNTSTTVVIGQTVTVNGFLGNTYSYQWVNDTSFLNCSSCSNPVSTTTSNITYTVRVVDLPLACFEVLNEHSVIVLLVSSIDVPTAFTPNNDGINDFIMPAGWGIRKLNYFKVFNRWGQLLFESNDLDKGWDGTFNGVPQNMETYIYQASVDTYTDETLTKSGSFKLIR